MSAPPPRIDVVPLGFVDRRPGRRDRILEFVLRGRITPERAEAWAAENGEAAFAEEPDPSRFDPMVEVDWTPAMVVAWGLYRAPEAVRQAWDAFLAECWQWRSVDLTVARPAWPGGCRRFFGHQLDRPELPSAASTLDRAVTTGAPLAMAVEEVERGMRLALRTGKLAAFAHGEVEPIPPRTWADVSPFDRPSRRGRHDAVYGAGGELLFTGVKIEREAVMALWPPPAPIPTARAPGRPSLEALWLPEFERREAAGANAGVEAMASAIREWLQGEVQAGRVALPARQQVPAAQTIANTIRRHRQEANIQK